MSIPFYSPTDWRLALGLTLALMLFGLSVSGHSLADDTTPEHARLEAVLRQIDTIERLIAEETARSRIEQNRYYFDYTRLTADLERMRSGIRDYLAPSRAQPRDPAALSGNYRQPTPLPASTPEETP